MRVYNMKFTGNEYYLVIDLLRKYSDKCFEESEKEYKSQSESWNANYRQVNKECGINARDLMQRMYTNVHK